MSGQPIVAVVGPTASGKTGLGVHLAERFGGEVISADALQVYDGLSVCTARPTAEEMHGVPHHLVGFLKVTERYSVNDYCRDAAAAAGDIISRGKLPVVVGGTGLYVDSFLSNTAFAEDARSDDVRNALKEELAAGGIEPLFAELTRVDPEYAAKIHPNNTVRVLRALEIFRSCGLTPTGQAALSHRESSPYRPLYIGLGFRDRAVLYGRIDARVDGMVANGLVREAAAFYAASPAETAANAIGCKELKPYLDGEQSLEACVDSLKRATRRYAKRQLTWFRRNGDVRWLYVDDYGASGELYAAADTLVSSFLDGENDTL